jgi:hypothetical protein
MTKEECEICEQWNYHPACNSIEFIHWLIERQQNGLLKKYVENQNSVNLLSRNGCKDASVNILNYLNSMLDYENRPLGDVEKYKKIKKAISKIEEAIGIINETYN